MMYPPILIRWTARALHDHVLRTGHCWFWYYKGSIHWWNLRLWCDDHSAPVKA